MESWSKSQWLTLMVSLLVILAVLALVQGCSAPVTTGESTVVQSSEATAAEPLRSNQNAPSVPSRPQYEVTVGIMSQCPYAVKSLDALIPTVKNLSPVVGSS